MQSPTMVADFYVFLYGTLRVNGGNYELLAGRSEYVGTFKTRDPYTMFTGDLDGSPYITDLYLVNEEPTPIVGELHRMYYDVLQDIDALEGHPEYMRRREIVLETGQVAWAYFLNDGPFQQMRTQTVYYLPSGDWFNQDDVVEIR